MWTWEFWTLNFALLVDSIALLYMCGCHQATQSQLLQLLFELFSPLQFFLRLIIRTTKLVSGAQCKIALMLPLYLISESVCQKDLTQKLDVS